MDSYDAIADPVRRRMLEVLADGPRPVRDLVGLFPISQPAVSRHLRVLRAAGVVESFQLDDDARLRLYRLLPQPLNDVREWLEVFWQGKLDSFAMHARERA